MAKKPIAGKNIGQKIGQRMSSFRDAVAGALGFSHEGARDLYASFGYPKEIGVNEYMAMYSRNDIANRIVASFPKATWRDAPTYSDEAGSGIEKGKDGYSEFAASVDQLFEDHNVLAALERVDRLASVCRFGLLVIGYDDGLPPGEPLSSTAAKLIYLQPFAEPNVTINRWCTDPKNPRFGKPETYTVQYRPDTGGQGSIPMQAFQVHHSRCLHVAEIIDQDTVYGLPRLKPIFNRLKDLEKVVGGASENYWLLANRGLFFSVDKEMDLDEEGKKAIETQVDDFQHKTKRWIIGQGITATPMGDEHVDPSPFIDKLIDLCAGTVGIPKRILLGTERGELSSQQDENNWAQRIAERRKNWAVPYVLKPLIAKLVLAGALPQPKGNFNVTWGDSDTLSEEQKATIASTKSTALATYAGTPDAQLIVPIPEFRESILGLPAVSAHEIPDIEEISEDDPEDGGPWGRQFNEAAKSLYVSRKVTNAKAIVDWAKRQGIKNIEDDLHVTVCYSETPVQWEKFAADKGKMMLHASNSRSMALFGEDETTLVLCFNDESLLARHKEFLSGGATHSWGSYKAHVTISKDMGTEFDKIVPYTGAITLGPEEFAEIED